MIQGPEPGTHQTADYKNEKMRCAACRHCGFSLISMSAMFQQLFYSINAINTEIQQLLTNNTTYTRF